MMKPNDPNRSSPITAISAVTLITGDMDRAVSFYESLGFRIHYGGRDASFTSFHAGDGYLNLQAGDSASRAAKWGRMIYHVDDVDAMYACCIDAGLTPQFPPRDADWGERYFHIADPDGHEISFAKPL